MALFGRGKNNIDNVPQEVRDYYESERRERSGVAWLLALATLVVTLVLAGGIFLGGRWAYRQVVNRNEPARVANNDAQEANSNNQQQQSANEQSNTDNQSNDQNQNNQPGQPADNNEQNDNQPAPSQPATPAAGQSGNSGTSGTPATGTSSTSTSTPSSSNETAAQPSNLTNTGPADTLGVFVAVTAFATLVHYYVSSRRSHRTSV